MRDQLLVGDLVEVMHVYWKSGSYPESVATFAQAGPTTTELNPAAKSRKSYRKRLENLMAAREP